MSSRRPSSVPCSFCRLRLRSVVLFACANAGCLLLARGLNRQNPRPESSKGDGDSPGLEGGEIGLGTRSRKGESAHLRFGLGAGLIRAKLLIALARSSIFQQFSFPGWPPTEQVAVPQVLRT